MAVITRGLIEPGALVAALRSGWPGTAAVDAFEEVPLVDTTHPLVSLDHVVCTAHIGTSHATNGLQFNKVFD
jgi:D-3-phosphoglycerate dehydrogenase / 2-oxoglutarate reductase